MLEWPHQPRWAIAVKRSLSPSLGKGFHQARADLAPAHSFVVIPGDAAYPLANGVEVLGLAALAERLRQEPMGAAGVEGAGGDPKGQSGVDPKGQ